MPKKRKTTKEQENGANAEVPDRNRPIEALDAMNELKKSWPVDVGSIFSVDMEQQRRQELWEMVVDSAASVCDRFAWATPDERSFRILHHFSPIIEIGAGAGYWAYCMQQRGIECDAFDMFPPVTSASEGRPCWTTVHTGGPDVLRESSNAHKTLLLCYPDDFEESDESMAAECLEALQGDTVVHCGELFGDCPMLDKAPWGRTSAAAFQQHLFSVFRCVLKVPLPSWPHCNDHLTVWRRVQTCCVRLPASEGGASSAATSAASDSGDPGASDPGGSTAARSPPGAPCAAAGAPCAVPRAAEASPNRPAAAADGRDSHDGSGGVRSGARGSGASEPPESGDDDDDDAEIEFVCDFRSFGLATEQPARGWAIAPLQHLL